MSVPYPFTVQFDGRPTPARLGGPGDPFPGLYLDLGEAGERLVSIGCGEDVVRQLTALVASQREALTKLSNEIGGLLGAFRNALCDLVSTTKVRCLELRRDEAGLVLLDSVGRQAAAEWARDREDAEKWRTLQAAVASASIGPRELAGLAEELQR
jgi:hypothetical protein